MDYKNLLSKYIKDSKLSLSKIEEKMRTKGFSTNKSYISKLQNGILPPAGEDITRALAEVTGGDPETLIVAAYIEKAPDSVKKLFLLEPMPNKVLNNINESMRYENKKLEIMANILNKYNFDISDPKKQKMLEDMIEFALKHSD